MPTATRKHMALAVQRSTLHAPDHDRAYWLQRPPEERLAAVEELRRQLHCTPGMDPNDPNAQPRLQRVCRVVERQRG